MANFMRLAAISMLLPGCASIVTGTNQSVSVETPGCPGAMCELSNDKGTWYVASTPGSVTVHRAYGDLTVVCKKPKSEKDTIGAVSSSTKGMAFGNILFGGLIGAGVDVGTGAAYDYPSKITIPMKCTDPEDRRIEAEPLSTEVDELDIEVEAVSPDNQLEECSRLEVKMENAEDKPFTQAVLRKKYEQWCDEARLDMGLD